MRLHQGCLLAGGVLSFCAAALHLAIVFVPEWSSIFGERQEPNRLVFQTATSAVTALLTLWGLYGLSGAGMIRRLPLLRLGIFLVGAVYIPYGLLAGSRLLGLVDFLPPSSAIHLQDAVIVLGALIAGIFYWTGLAIGWRRLERTSASV
jgi:hypothetical protein